MEQEQSQSSILTDPAMLVVWGQFTHCLGLVQAVEQVSLSQKSVDHSPQGKVLEFLVAILDGLEYLKDISLSARLCISRNTSPCSPLTSCVLQPSG